MCLVCGLKNPLGLRAAFYDTETNEVVAIFTPAECHQSYPGRLHGGITAGILDEVIGRAINANREQTTWGVTMEFTVQLKKPIPLNVELRVIGRITRETSRTFEGAGELLLPDNTVAAFGRGKYFKLPVDKIADFDFEAQEWRVTTAPNDPKVIET